MDHLFQTGDMSTETTIQHDSRWLNGPAFLWKEENCWPAMIEVPELKDSDAEVRKESRIYAISVAQDTLLLFLLETEERTRLAVTLQAVYTKHSL